MIGVKMYSKVKVSQAEGLSQREISKRLGINRRTVKKFMDMELQAASDYFWQPVNRSSQFDVAKEFIISKLSQYQTIRSSNLYYQVKERYEGITAKKRAFRNYVRKLKSELNFSDKPKRKYEPVTDWQPGKQMQVDGGEYTVDFSDGKSRKIYFVSFELCYSRMRYTHYSSKHYNTSLFIEAHQSAFNYFGGIPQVCVYDQAKVVVVKEEYRELLANKSFQKFFLEYGFMTHICEGYDPESKGMVENCIGFFKHSFLEGRVFDGINDIQRASNKWLECVNREVHNTTKRQPQELFEEERKELQPLRLGRYPDLFRGVDRTGLISYASCKYSVPEQYQRKTVRINVTDGLLQVYDVDGGNEIAVWDTIKHRSGINKNPDHYRDRGSRVAEVKQEVTKILTELNVNRYEELIIRLTDDNPERLGAQYRALKLFLSDYERVIWESAIDEILALPIVTCTRIRTLLEIKKQHFIEEKVLFDKKSEQSKDIFRSLAYYNRFI
jgi:transposase